MDENELVCLNDGSGSKVNLVKGNSNRSHIGITVSGRVEREIVQDEREGRWTFEEADWNER